MCEVCTVCNETNGKICIDLQGSVERVNQMEEALMEEALMQQKNWHQNDVVNIRCFEEHS